MAITWTEGADTRQNVGFSWIQQENIATFGSSDYVLGGYNVNPAWFGFKRFHGMTVIGYTGTPSSYFWNFNKTTNNLQAFQGTAEATPGTNFIGLTLSILGYGF